MIVWLKDQQEEPIVYIADRRLYVNQDRSRLVEECDPEAYFLLVAAGGGLSEPVARRYGLIVDAPPPAKEEPEPAESKSVKHPPENKAIRSPAETK